MEKNNRVTTLIAGALGALMSSFFVLVLSFGNVRLAAFAALAGIPVALFANFVLSRYRLTLAKRVKSYGTLESSHVVWDVRMNGVLIDQIEDGRLAVFEESVVEDWRHMGTQALNVMGLPARIFNKMLDILPLVAFWFVAGFAMFDPEGLIQLGSSLRTVSPSELQHGAIVGICFLLGTTTIGCLLAWMVSGHYWYGLRNVWREEVANVIRRQLSIPATGDLTIERAVTGGVQIYAPDYFGWVRMRVSDK